MNFHKHELAALDHMFADALASVRVELRQLSVSELNTLAKALDDLAAEVDDEAIKRVEKRA